MTCYQAKMAVAKFLAYKDGISEYCAEDVVDHVQSVVAETLTGESIYYCCSSVLKDYGIPVKYLWVFLWEV